MSGGRAILVVGATGLLGAPVAERLRRDGHAVRLLARDPGAAAARFGAGFEVVRGDLLEPASLDAALDGCLGVHVNLSGELEQVGVERVVAAAVRRGVERVTYVSGTSVAAENTWVPLIRRKFAAERAVRESGLGHGIFCPAWFMEVLPRYVRGRRAVVFGRQPNPYHFVAAEDYARMVAASYALPEPPNRRLFIHGPEGIRFHEAVRRYCAARRPEVRRVVTMPHRLATLVSRLTRKPEMKAISDWMADFARIGELGDPAEANRLLGAPRIRLDDWLR